MQNGISTPFVTALLVIGAIALLGGIAIAFQGSVQF